MKLNSDTKSEYNPLNAYDGIAFNKALWAAILENLSVS